ncbi:hypothetical protein CHGG_04744 [Chaetomium globosum CBS 148.51]|uniref:Fatty acid hydroxylase domain-containing protein n=1 Tax=Chaetomium globosum (strain ATCC 6205 / CBS 148.51 / DSM 1962 / NBRC 6347 / NRRL 1970) TaxID=306901 RepID=Q2H0F2_CHAGB|nr:uncharacterized protein CHGG_04744 [Chaetomium globosum CBS 148.51]EAQ88125.1 hypothetical protein CHGG_04744 [Chaetomium globosum CBS 148.51]
MASAVLNSTISGLSSSASITTVFEEVSKYNVQLNVFERLWASWYLWMQNDTIATGIMSFVMHEFVYFGRSLPWIIIDAIPFFNKYKLQNTKVPTWKEQWECAGLVLLSHCTVELPQIWLFHPIATYFGLDYGVPFPPAWKMAMQIAIFFAVEDAWHYWMHRALHYGPLYKSIHKLHHTYSAPFGLAAEYASPIEAIDAHSGYDFPWSLRRILPFWAGADHHDLHHERFIGNYASSFRWWDYCLDTEAGEAASKQRRERKLAEIRAKKAQ